MNIKLFQKEIQNKLKEVEVIDQKLHQIKQVIYKFLYLYPAEKSGFAFNNLKETWSSKYSEKELDDALKEIRTSWRKEIKEFGLE